MYSDDDDVFSYTPLQRSQVSKREGKPTNKASRLSLSLSQRSKRDVKPSLGATWKVKTEGTTIESAQGKSNKATNSQQIPQKRKAEGKDTKSTPKKSTKTNNSQETPQKRRTPKSTPKKSAKTNASQETPQKRKTPKSTPRKSIKKGTPVKSRADHPEPNCSEFELRKWNFLYGSHPTQPGTSESGKRKIETDDSLPGPSTSSQWKKNVHRTKLKLKMEEGSDDSTDFHDKNLMPQLANGTPKQTRSRNNNSHSEATKANSPDVILLSDSDSDGEGDGKHTFQRVDSEPLFDLSECDNDDGDEYSLTIDLKDRTKSNPSPSVLEPNIDIQEEDTRSTLYFNEHAGSSISDMEDNSNLPPSRQPPSRTEKQDHNVPPTPAIKSSENLNLSIKTDHNHHLNNQTNQTIIEDQCEAENNNDMMRVKDKSKSPSPDALNSNQNSATHSTGEDSWMFLANDEDQEDREDTNLNPTTYSKDQQDINTSHKTYSENQDRNTNHKTYSIKHQQDTNLNHKTYSKDQQSKNTYEDQQDSDINHKTCTGDKTTASTAPPPDKPVQRISSRSRSSGSTTPDNLNQEHALNRTGNASRCNSTEGPTLHSNAGAVLNSQAGPTEADANGGNANVSGGLDANQTVIYNQGIGTNECDARNSVRSGNTVVGERESATSKRNGDPEEEPTRNETSATRPRECNSSDVLPCDWTEVDSGRLSQTNASAAARPQREDPPDLNAEMTDSGDEIIANLTAEALDTFAIPVTEKILQWRKTCEEAQSIGTKDRQGTRLGPDAQPTSSNQNQRTVIQPVNIHFHFHEAPPPSSKSKSSGGQKSILAYFKRTSEEGHTSSSGEETVNTRKKNIEDWKSLMNRMKEKRNLVPLPTIGTEESSVCEVPGGASSTHHPSPPTTRPPPNNINKTQTRRPPPAGGAAGAAGGAGAKRQCPFYKYIPGTNFVVDAFNYGTVEGVKAYFLTHFHYDHYQGLKKTFAHPIYCSKITGKLVNQKLLVPLKYIYALPMWEPQEVCGVEVTLLDANHCPGAVMFLFKLRTGVTHLHVGDFRAHPSMESYPALQCQVSTLFLDTTYCSHDYVFPSQEDIISRCVSIAKEHDDNNNKTLFAVGSYMIGKERIFQAIAASLNASIWVRTDKRRILNCIDNTEISKRLSTNKLTSKVHVITMKEINAKKLSDYLSELKPTFTEVVGFRPTGWTFTAGGDEDGVSHQHSFDHVHVYGIPYSEHSSYRELERFVKFVKPVKIIPTVNNGSKVSRDRMEKIFTKWRESW